VTPDTKRKLKSLPVFLLCLAALEAGAAVFPGAAWEKRPPASVGLDERKLAEFAAKAGGDGCIIKDGYLVKSWGGIAAHQDWASAAKPVLSTLLLLAVQERRLSGVDALVKDVGWDLAPKDSTMTFRHLANMVSGYACGEAPGQAWGYNDYAVKLLARSLEKIFNQPLDAACRQRLAALQFEDGAIFGSRDGLRVVASPRDFARLGWLWLNRGQWKNRRIVSSKLFTKCVRPAVPPDLPRTSKKGHDYLGIGSFGGGTDQTPAGPGIYGFNFWFNERLSNGQRVWPAAPADTYQANGMWNRDTVTIFPSLRMVVAVRGAKKSGGFEPGNAKGKYNQNMKRLMEAVRQPPDVPGKKRKTVLSASQDQGSANRHDNTVAALIRADADDNGGRDLLEKTGSPSP
jgi:CubicO group peptidase (beta-lactamase class C family)